MPFKIVVLRPRNCSRLNLRTHRIGANPEKSALVRRGKGSWLVGGTRLVAFPRPNRPQFDKATSPGPPLEPGPLAPCPFPKRCRRRGGVPAGKGVPARGILRPIRGQEAWEYHEPGPPNEPGPLAFSHLVNFRGPD